jgi:hypothetical protein
MSKATCFPSRDTRSCGRDTFELRDGTVLTGGFVSVSGKEVQLRIAGAPQTIDCNKIKRILLTKREPASN